MIDLGLRESVMVVASNEDYPITPQDPFGLGDPNNAFNLF